MNNQFRSSKIDFKNPWDELNKSTLSSTRTLSKPSHGTGKYKTESVGTIPRPNIKIEKSPPISESLKNNRRRF